MADEAAGELALVALPDAGAPARAPARTLTACGAGFYGVGRSACDGSWYAWCVLTGEQRLLPTPVVGYELQMDEDGDTLLADGGETASLGDYMQRMLYSGESGAFYTVAASESEVAAPVRLESEVHMQTLHRLTVRMDGRGPEECDFFLFALPRSGARIAWNLHHVVRALRLSVVDEKRPARWLYSRFDSWQRFCATELERPLDLRRGLQHAADRYAGEDVLRDLSVPTLLTPSLLGLLARMAGRNRGTGGLKSQGDQQLAKAFLGALLKELSHDDFDLYIFFDSEVQVAYPSLWHGSELLRLKVVAGMLSTRPLFDHNLGRGAFCGRRVFLECDLNDGEVSLIDFMVSLARSPPASSGPLLKQLAWQTGLRLDSLIALAPSSLVSLKARDIADELFEATDPRKVDAALARYWQAGMEAADGARVISVSVDKTRGNSKGLSNAVIVLPQNTAFWTPPQVVPDYVTVQEMAKDADSVVEAKSMVEGHLENSRKRQRAWLTRQEDGSWKPRKRHRFAAYKWCMTLENHLRSAGLELKTFQAQELPTNMREALDQPRLSVAADLGGDGFCATGFLTRERSIVCDFVPDASHGIHNNINLAIHRCGLREHAHLSLIARNAQHGPWHEARRYFEVKNSLAEVFEDERPLQSPLFIQLLPLILADLNWPHRIGEEGIEKEIWQLMQDDSPWRTKGTHQHPSRFLGPVRLAKKELPMWHMRCFGYTYASIELGFLTGKNLQKLALRIPQAGAGPAARMRGPGLEEKAIRSCMANTMTLCTLFLSDMDQLVYTKIIVTGVQYWDQWHSEQNKRLRSAMESEAWIKEQVAGKYLQCMSMTLGVLHDVGAITNVGFEVQFEAWRGLLTPEHTLVARDDEYADHLAMLIMELSGLRLKWAAWMLLGWGGRSVAFLPGDGHDPGALLEFRRQAGMHELLIEKANHYPGVLQEILQRSTFSLPVIRQLLAAVGSEGDLAPAVSEWLSQCHRRVLATQVIEDGNKRQRRREQNMTSKVSRCSNEFKVLIRGKVLGEVHHFAEVSPHPHALGKSVSLPRSAYMPFSHKASIDCKTIASFRQQTSWYSPRPDEHCVQFTDLALVDILASEDSWEKANNIWLSCLVDGGRMLLRRRAPPGQPWLLALRPVPGSASFALVVTANQVLRAPGVYLTYYTFAEQRQLTFYCILDARDWDAMFVQWRSPAWFYSQVGRGAPKLCGAVPDGPADSLLRVAAKQAFFDLSIPKMKAIANYAGMQTGAETDDFNLCFNLVCHVLGVDEDAAIDIVSKRAWRCNTKVGDAMNALMEFEEADDMLTKQDFEDLVRTQKEVRAQVANQKRLLQRARSKRREVQERRYAKAKPKAKAQAKAAAARPWGSREFHPVPAGALEQADAARLCPPGGHIWRNNYGGGWQCHLKDFKRLATLDRIVGHREGALLCLRHLWSDYLTKKCDLPLSACPVPGLMPDDEGPAAEGGGHHA